MNKNTSALADATKCVELDNQWTKGLSRKGDALYSLGRYTESYNAYNSALRISPNDSTLNSKCEQAQKAIRDSTSNSGSQSPSNKGGLLGRIQRHCRTAIVIGLFMYLLPLGSTSVSSYKLAVGAAVINYIISLYSTHGMPQFNTSYAQRILPDPTTMYDYFLYPLLS